MLNVRIVVNIFDCLSHDPWNHLCLNTLGGIKNPPKRGGLDGVAGV